MQSSAPRIRRRVWPFLLPARKDIQLQEGDQLIVRDIPRPRVVRVFDPDARMEFELELLDSEEVKRFDLGRNARIEVEHISSSTFYVEEVIHEIDLERKEE